MKLSKNVQILQNPSFNCFDCLNLSRRFLLIKYFLRQKTFYCVIAHSVKRLKFFVWIKSFVLKIFRFLCFGWIHRLQSLSRHHRHCYTLYISRVPEADLERARPLPPSLFFCNHYFFFFFFCYYFEELQTLLVEVKLIINNAPLTYVYPNTIKTYLTLNHF